jgi:hypothetical protein
VILGTRADLLGAVVVDGRLASVLDPRWDHLPVIANHTTDGLITSRATDQVAMVEVHDVARYLIADGTVTIDVHPDAADEAVRSWLYGSVAALVAGQAGRFALHASVIDIDGICVAVTGQRGAGKSTTTLAAAQRGATLVVDDVAVLTTAPTLMVHPFGRPVHVWNPTASRLGIDVTGAPPVASGYDKVSLPAPVDDQPRVLHAMVVLRPGDVEAPVVHPVRTSNRLRVVRNQTYRLQLADALWPQELFRWQAEVARKLDIIRMVRPEAWSVDAVVAEVTAFAHRLRS